MSLNTLPVAAAGRQPRAIVRINGTAVPGWLSWSCTSNDYYEADTFRVSFAASAMGTSSAQPFIEQTELFVEILAGFPTNPDAPNASELGSLIYGRVDEMDFDPFARTLTFHGRDLTGAFIDARLDSDYQAQHASDVATLLAAKHGLVPKVTATAGLTGGYYKHDQVKMHANQSEWDLLAYLAREVGFQCYVLGQELHFEPDTAGPGEPYVINWQPGTNTYAAPAANVQSLSFSRALTVSKGVSVTVRSPSLTKKVAVVQSYPTKAKAIQAGKASPFGNVQAYYFTTAANRDATQVQQEAQRRYNELITHEMKLHATLPGDNLLTTKGVLRVQGTGTSFDQDYYPNEITREMSMDEGYTMTVSAKNHSPQVVPAP